MLLSNCLISDQFRKPAVFAQFNVFFKTSLNLPKAAAVGLVSYIYSVACGNL